MTPAFLRHRNELLDDVPAVGECDHREAMPKGHEDDQASALTYRCETDASGQSARLPLADADLIGLASTTNVADMDIVTARDEIYPG
ncbi:MAG: hypothetical protein ACT4QB_16980 [Gammaproteobacteria bacterium]